MSNGKITENFFDEKGSYYFKNLDLVFKAAHFGAFIF